MKKAPAAPVPTAAAKPRGKQQLIVATELTIAANDAETPVPCLTAIVLAVLPGPLNEPSLLTEDRSALTLGKDGN